MRQRKIRQKVSPTKNVKQLKLLLKKKLQRNVAA